MKIINIEPSDSRISLIRVKKPIDSRQPKNCIHIGAGADVTRRFLASAINEFRTEYSNRFQLDPNLFFIPSDIRPKVDINLPSSIPVNETIPFINGNGDLAQNIIDSISNTTEKVNAYYISSPTQHHFSNLSSALKANTEMGTFDIPIFVEKPPFTPETLAQGIELIKDRKNVVAVDFFVYNRALNFLIEHCSEELKSIGTIKEIHGRCVEPNKVETGREWLLKDGLGYDMAIHSLAMIDRFLMAGLNKGFSTANIQTAFFGKYNDAITTKYPGETYYNTHLNVDGINIYADGGKGVGGLEGGRNENPFPYYGITIVGERGQIEVFAGSEKYRPYISITYNDKSGSEDKLIQLPIDGLGYEALIGDLSLAAHKATLFTHDPNSEIFQGLSNRLHTMTRAAIDSASLIVHTHQFRKNEVIDITCNPAPESKKVSGRVIRDAILKT